MERDDGIGGLGSVCSHTVTHTVGTDGPANKATDDDRPNLMWAVAKKNLMWAKSWA